MGTAERRGAAAPRERREQPLRCRICARPLAQGARAARIFAEEGRRRNLQRNIHKYLCITVTSEDRLPKMVCASCMGKLDGIHAFATMALRSQERLKKELLKTSSDIAIILDSSDSSDSSANKLGDRGLLHSILTKGSTEQSTDGESTQGRQRIPSTEEMEVKVDPMIFLQCASEQPSSAEYSDFSNDSDKEVSSYGSPPHEPLSLTKKDCKMEKENEKSKSAKEDLDGKEESEEEDMEDDTSDPRSKQHVCKVCAKSFATQISLQNHLWSHLPTTTGDVCREYVMEKEATRGEPKVFLEGGNGVANQNSSGSEDGPLDGTFICPICGKKISTKGNLKVHLETHRPKGKYGCDICGRIFKTQSNLFRHKEYHSGVQFPCGVCGRVYPTNSTLRAHSITHSDLRPHACPLCDKTFKRNQDLKFHINQHTGARPYQCPYCPKAFASSGNCFSHRKRMHPKEVHRDRQRAADLMR